MEEIVRQVAHYVAMGLEFLSVLMVAVGAIEAVIRLAPALRLRGGSQGARRAAFLSLGRWLVLGLEFMLAADIVDTVISPTWEDLGQLAAIALIRTFLNYFLERDLDAAQKEASSPAASQELT